MSKNIPPDEADRIFFRNAMKSVKRIRSVASYQKKLAIPKPHVDQPSSARSKAIARPVTSQEQKTLLLSDPTQEARTDPEQVLVFKRIGPSAKLLKKLAQAKLPTEACLDLHGLTVEEARQAFTRFLINSQQAGFHCVKIIHGKGRSSHRGAVLKHHVNHWLPQVAFVLAFASAPAHRGGTGLVNVLLKKNSLFITHRT